MKFDLNLPSEIMDAAYCTFSSDTVGSDSVDSD